ncbi:protein ELYS isoform X1 [Bombyx mori]|uniref:Protein ELYS n=1 Tax=Bombyx mori TaxID=7091 RepID=A0A8R2AXJ5_BOMMO|nr:protein ELYS isoform X1 [Bombyx mori]XP_037869924.1 protein ELYS isoform X2 [Bombyx mori]
MQKLQDSVFSIIKTTNLSPAVFSFLQPKEEFEDNTPLGGILKDTKHGWLALGPKFCVVDLRTGLKVAARTFGHKSKNSQISVKCVVELPRPLSENSKQLVISLQCDDMGLICFFHINGSQILRCIQTEVVITQLSVCDALPDGVLSCFDGIIMAGTKNGAIVAIDLNRDSLRQALKDTSEGYEHLIHDELRPVNLSFLPYKEIHDIDEQRELALENDDHLSILLNENSLIDGQFMFRNPDGTVQMKAKKDHIRVTVLQYLPQLASLAVGYNFGAFQIWNMMTLDLEFTSQVKLNIDCLPVTHFGFQEPCDDPRAFCYLWVIYSVIDKFEDEEFPLAVMYSLTYQGKRMLSDTKCLYQDFSSAAIRFELKLCGEENSLLLGGKCVSCHTYSVNSMLGAEGEDSMLNICQLVWECWGENPNSSLQYGMLLFDLDQWYKDQMPETYSLESNAFMSVIWCPELSAGGSTMLDVRLDPHSVAVYCHATRLEEHFYPNSLQYNCVSLNTSESSVLGTVGIQRQLLSALEAAGPAALLHPAPRAAAARAAGLAPLFAPPPAPAPTPDEQRKFLLSVALEARLCRFLKRCAHDWATGSHAGVGCTLSFMIDWCWSRALELKENAKEITSPLFTSFSLPDRNSVRNLEHCVQQLMQLTSLLDAILTKCCNLIVPDALSEIEEKYKGIGTVSLYFQVVQWFLRVGLLPERLDAYEALPYPAEQLHAIYAKRRLKLNRLQDNASHELGAQASCSLLYIDQLIEQEFAGDRIHQMWMKGGSESGGVYPPPSLYALLRLYLLPDIADEHKHSLVLYLLLDYCMVYDDVRYEGVIRRLMQFPTMFGLSNTAIKATQAFWHLDHRDFDFALDQLQCLTGNTLSEWQHHVVLSSLLAQNKTQAALQYLHVRKPAPIQMKNGDFKIHDQDKLEDWQSCCSLYLARGLVFEALDVVRMCVQSATTAEHKKRVLDFFFRGCHHTGNLAKLLQAALQEFEEEVFIKYLENCNESQTSDILIMYYLQHARYLEAEQYNNKLKQSKPRPRDMSTSVESLQDAGEGDAPRDVIVSVLCSSLPRVARTVARDLQQHNFDTTKVFVPRPMSVFVQAASQKNTCTYKSSFIQSSIENASETWVSKPRMRRGIKRALNVEDTPFICTPKLIKTRSVYSDEAETQGTPPKRPKFDPTYSPKTPKSNKKVEKLSSEMASLLDIPEMPSPDYKPYSRLDAGTPHSILKMRRNDVTDAPSPVDSRYLGESEDEALETASNHTHCSDSANKYLRFAMPSESAWVSPPISEDIPTTNEKERSSVIREIEMDVSNDSYVTSASRPTIETYQPASSINISTKKDAVKSVKSYKDNVKARRSLSISVNSSLSDDPNTSIESIADIPITLINPRYTGERRQSRRASTEANEQGNIDDVRAKEMEALRRRARADEHAEWERDVRAKETGVSIPATPRGRRGIRSVSDGSTPKSNASIPGTPERYDSPIATPLRSRVTRSRSRTPELSPRTSPLAPIPEQPKQEIESDPHPERTTLSVPRNRSRSKTPDKIERTIRDSPKLEPIRESPIKSSNTESSTFSPRTRSLRSRSRTPEVESLPEQNPAEVTPNRPLRSVVHSKTPEKMSPRTSLLSRKKPLSRMVLEANTFKTQQTEQTEDQEPASAIECTPMKSNKKVSNLMDVTLSPIVNKSILHSSNDSVSELHKEDTDKTDIGMKTLPAFTTIHEVCAKSVLCSYESSTMETSELIEIKQTVENIDRSIDNLKSLPAFTTLNNTEVGRSVLQSFESSVEASSANESKDQPNTFSAFSKMIESDFERSVLHSFRSSVDDKREASSLITNDSDVDKADEVRNDAIQTEKEKIVEIEREIHEIEGDMSGDDSESDEEIIEAEEAEGEDDSSESSSSSSTSSEDEADVISIQDTDSEDSNRKVDEQQKQETENVQVQAGTVEETSSNNAGPPAQLSLLTDDASGVESDRSDIQLNYSDEKVTEDKDTVDEGANKVSEPQAPIQVHVVVEKVASAEDLMGSKEIESENVALNEILPKTDDNKDENAKTETKDSGTNKQVDSELKDNAPDIVVSEDKELEKTDTATEETVKGRRTRKRATSTASNQSMDEPKTPATRKRINSNASLAEELTTPETADVTPSSRRAKTPTSAEVRRIVTRRISKEMGEKLEERSLEELTPKRRATRSRSKNIDDNESVASESSFVSNKSKASEDLDKAGQGRRTRKSVVATKPELSVIPEAAVEESKEGSAIIDELSKSRRMTRGQQTALSTLLEKRPAPRTKRRSSAAASSSDDEPPSAFDVQPMDRISLLNKTDYEGIPDDAELQSDISPTSVASEAAKFRRKNMTRAASESKLMPKPAKIGRRISVDIDNNSELGSPVASVSGSPARGRRASFARACEALLTPKGRRASTDVKKGDESPEASPAPSEGEAVSASRRPRRASTHSNTSATKTETSKRSKRQQN